MAVSATRVDVGSDSLELLRRLLKWQSPSGETKILTLYLNLDPREFATAAARESELNALLDEARSSSPGNEWNAALERVHDLFAREDYEITDAHGLALICSQDCELFEVLKLPRPVPRSAVFADHPHVRPILEVLPGDLWCAFLVNRKAARTMLGGRDEFHQVSDSEDDVGRRHDQGGWSQARYQRAVDEEARDHVRRACQELYQLWRQIGFQCLLLGAPEEMRGQVESELHNDLKPRIAGWVDVDINNVTEQQLHQAAAPLIEQRAVKLQRELLERLRQGAASNGRGAMGVDAVLSALNERRVETLIIAQGYSREGWLCPQCGWMSATETTNCPSDGEALAHQDDVVESAVEAALLQAATVRTIGRVSSEPHGNNGGGDLVDRPEFLELQGYGSIAALLRF